jgi:hypothetical protein
VNASRMQNAESARQKPLHTAGHPLSGVHASSG